MDSTRRPLDHQAIEECAAAWLARRDGGEWSSEDEARLAAWLNEATAHRVALLRLESAWEGARRARALSALPAGTVPPAGEWRQSPYFQGVAPATAGAPARHRARRWWTAAACCALAVGLGSIGYIRNWYEPGDVYSTPVGVISSVPLADGSVVTLNTASAIRVEFAPNERRVVLERGEAYFAVKRNPARPFIVIAGEQRIVDVGTQFSVRRNPAGIQVVVTEGAVRVETPPPDASHGGGGAAISPALSLAAIDVPLSAGSVALAQDGDVLVHKESVREAEEMVSWREGYLTFRDTTLARAVAELNRYNVRRIVIRDPGVAGIRISGTFRPTNYEAFVRLLHEGYGIDVRETGEGITLSKE
ncbi:MAG TPA: FecR domain-containing protein [Steroidobacteraceae bacterium]